MLIEFRVQNHRSLREEQVLTFAPAYNGGDDDPRLRVADGYPEPLLTAAAIYGANASGKSNLVEALAFMQEAVLYSHRSWEPEGGVPRDPFAWGAASAEPSSFEVTFLNGGIRYRYGFVVSCDRFVEEWLHAWPKKRQQSWFTRDVDEFKFGEHLKGENRVVEQVTRANALFLSAAVQHRHEQLAPVYRWFRSLAVLNTSRQRLARSTPSADRWLTSLLRWAQSGQQVLFEEENSTLSSDVDALLGLMRAADVGIVDLKLETDDDAGGRLRSRERVLVRHQHSTVEAWLPLDQESHGTQTLLRLAPAFLQTLRSGTVLAIDELDAGLHPLLAEHVIRQFIDPRSNPRKAQILFTTHNTNMLGTVLGEPLLRRDQVWLTEKDRDGATSLSPLADYKPRKAENLERGYLQGRYGGIPILGDMRGVDPE
jgi:uncharacterized protein